jgi:glutathione S-transferase
MTGELILYDFVNAPSARRARMFILEKGIEVTRVTVDLAKGEHLLPSYLAVNPAGLVPALKLADGEIITENDGIAAYLEAAFPTPALLGATPLMRGRIMQWNARLELEGLLPLAAYLRNRHPAFIGRAVPGTYAAEQIPALAERGRDQVSHFLPTLDRQLREHAFVAGAEFSYADITAIVFIDFMTTARLSVPLELNALLSWAERIRRRPSYQNSLR